MKSSCLVVSILALAVAPLVSLGQTATATDAKVQAPEMAAPQRGSLAGQLASTVFGPADVARGGFSLPAPFVAPDARGALLADVFPTYSSDAGMGEWGMGWRTALLVTRSRIIGDLDYATDEITGPWGRMVQGTDGYWYPIGLSKPVRVSWSGDTLIAYLADGTQMTFGGSARIANLKGSYAWPLVDVVSVTGRRTSLTWQANASGRPFLATVSYGGVGTDYQYRVDLSYEPLPLPFVDYRSGYPLALDQRVKVVTMRVKNVGSGTFDERWHYDLAYQDEGLGPASFLALIQQVFRSGEAPPPTQYVYNLSKDKLAAGTLATVSSVAPILSAFGSDALQPNRSTVFDEDLDGVQDLEHNTQFTLIRHTEAGFEFEPLPPSPPDVFGRCRRPASATNPPRLLAQLAGGDSTYVIDLYSGGSLTTTTLSVCNRLGQRLGTQTLTGDWQPSANVRLVDLNRDHKPDLIRLGTGEYRVLPNESSGGTFAFGAMKRVLITPVFSPDTTWLHDFNGDGIPDLIARTASSIVVWYGKGNYDFETVGRSFSIRTAVGSISNLTSYGFTFVDANRDGLTDIILSNTTGNATSLFVNRGTYFQEVPTAALRSVGSLMSRPVVADFSGSGNIEVSFTKSGQGYAVALDGPETGLMASADDGKGTVLRFSYARALPAAGQRQRQAVLSRLTVESSGYDAISYDYAYQGPHLHSVGEFLLGFDHVTRSDPNTVDVVDFLNEDRYSGVLVATSRHDFKAPAADAFTSKVYYDDDAIIQGVAYRRLKSETSGFRDGEGAAVSNVTEYLEYAFDVCPSTVRTTLSSGVLTTQTTFVQLPALAGSLACLPGDITQLGAHDDHALNFGHETVITRNDVGLVTKVESVADDGRWTLQDVTYDSEYRVATAGAPGRGTLTFGYDSVTRLLRQVVRPDGVVLTAAARDPLLDELLTLQTTRGAASYQQFFSYDRQERLQSRRDDLGGATLLNPNETYAYRYPAATVPGSVYVSTLVDAVAASARDQVALVSAAGEAVGTATRVPEGWAFGRLASRSRARAETQGSLRSGAPAATDPTALDYPSLFAGAAAIDFTSASALAGAVEQRTTFHAGVERRVTAGQVIDGGVLAATSTENGTFSTTSRTDASKRVLTFDDEAGIRYAYGYDALGRVRQVLLPDGRKHTASYDGHGRPSKIVREGIATIDVAYDPVTGLPAVKQYSTPGGILQRTEGWSYDGIGRVAQERHVDAGGASKAYTNYWDGAKPSAPLATTAPGLLTAVTGDGYIKLLEYRVDGELTKRTVSLAGWRSVETTLGYVESGAVGSRTTRVLDPFGVQLARTDWRYGFDASGRPSTVTLNGVTLATYAYDANDILRAATFTNGDKVTFTPDDLTRRPVGSSQSTATGTVSTGQRTSIRGLLDNEVIKVGATSLSRQYDYWDQRFLKSSVDAQNSYGYEFDGFGIPTRIVRNLVSTSIVQTGDTLTAGSLFIVFDALGRTVVRGDLALVYGPDGQVTTAQRGTSRWSFIYDEAHQRRLKLAGGTPVAAYLEEGYLDGTGLAEPLTVGSRVVGLVRGGAFQTVATDLRGTVLAESDLTPRLASPFGQRDLHPALAAAIDYVQKGFDADLGLVRMGVRDYDPELNRFSTPDPLFLEQPDLCLKSTAECNLYAYAMNAPSTHTDPTGLSTWIDASENVQNVVNDKDLGIYRSLPTGVAGPPEKIGESHFWDSFTNGQGKPIGHVNVGKDITSDVSKIVDQARDMDLLTVVRESRDGRSLDIKASFPGVTGPGKAQQGFLFQGKYATLRDAGNILFGINSANKGLTMDQAMRGAGAWAQTKSLISGFRALVFGKQYGPAPYYGEDEITGTRVEFGFRLAPSMPDHRPPLYE